MSSTTSISNGPLPTLTAEDLNGLNRAVFEWADSVDQKQWERTAANLAPSLYMDFRAIGAALWPTMTPAEYVAFASTPRFLGRPELRSQHLVGASHYRYIAPDEVEGRHQVRAAHILFTDASLKEERIKGHGWSSNTHWYRKIDGVWKLSGMQILLHSHEHDFDGMIKLVSAPEPEPAGSA